MTPAKSTRTVTAFALAVRSPRSGVPAMANGAWWIVDESNDAAALRERATAMTGYLSSTAGDAVLLRVEYNTFSQRAKVTPIAKFITSGWCGLWQNNHVPGQLDADQQEQFEGSVMSFLNERDAETAAFHAERLARREAAEAAKADRKRKLLAGYAAAAVALLLAAAYFAVDRTQAKTAPGRVSDFERSGGYVIIIPDPESGVHSKWKMLPNGTRLLIGRGPLSTLQDD